MKLEARKNDRTLHRRPVQLREGHTVRATVVASTGFLGQSYYYRCVVVGNGVRAPFVSSIRWHQLEIGEVYYFYLTFYAMVLGGVLEVVWRRVWGCADGILN